MAIAAIHPSEISKLRRDVIREEMKDDLLPKDTRHRSHKKTHGAMSFVEMGRKMSELWMDSDEVTKSVFAELAKEGKELLKELQTHLDSGVTVRSRSSGDDAFSNAMRAVSSLAAGSHAVSRQSAPPSSPPMLPQLTTTHSRFTKFELPTSFNIRQNCQQFPLNQHLYPLSCPRALNGIGNTGPSKRVSFSSRGSPIASVSQLRESMLSTSFSQEQEIASTQHQQIFNGDEFSDFINANITFPPSANASRSNSLLISPNRRDSTLVFGLSNDDYTRLAV